MSTLERAAPYLASLLEDDAVKDNLQRAGARFTRAKARAGKRNSRRAAAVDPQVWARLREGAGFVVAALAALNAAPERRSSSHRMRWALLVLVMAVGAFVASDERARTAVLEAADRLRAAANGGETTEGEDAGA
jgi:hypothetical protein